jgi:hypothetical protein
MAQNDSPFRDNKTEIIKGKKYTGSLDRFAFCLLNAKKDTLLYLPEEYFTFDFRDFNKDGYKDVFLDLGGNTPERFDLLLFVPSMNRFKQILNFRDFPAPESISGTKYYYSYHKSGCADMHWDSDLFYIENFRATKIGNISGRQCDTKVEKMGVFVYKVKGDKKILFKKFPATITGKYKKGKWGFIKGFWNGNYRLFKREGK